MPTWRYFFTTHRDDGPESMVLDLCRSDEEGRDLNAQILNRTGRWLPYDFLERYHIIGTMEHDYVWITEERARELVADFLADGSLAAAPDEP